MGRHRWSNRDRLNKECIRCGCNQTYTLMPSQFGSKFVKVYFFKTVIGNTSYQTDLPKCEPKEPVKEAG